jgi:hypothetical protein
MIYKEVTIYTPLINTAGYSTYFDKILNVTKELNKLSGQISVRFDNKNISSLDIKCLNHTDSAIKKLFPSNSKKRYDKHFIQFSSKYAIISKDDFDRKWTDFASFEYYVSWNVKMLIIYMNLAKPGAFQTSGGIMIVKEKIDKTSKKRQKFDSILSIVGDSLELRDKLKWPAIKNLKLKTVLDFLGNHWNAFEKLPNSRIQRALNAFSYLFHDAFRDTGNDLFYSVLGIESLFVTGHDNIQKQVDIKTQILFGRRIDFKKRFNELYDFRSRYIHGQLNISNQYFGDDLDDHLYETHLNPLFENACFAVLILIASIQKHIELNKTELEFEYKLKDG